MRTRCKNCLCSSFSGRAKPLIILQTRGTGSKGGEGRGCEGLQEGWKEGEIAKQQ